MSSLPFLMTIPRSPAGYDGRGSSLGIGHSPRQKSAGKRWEFLQVICPLPWELPRTGGGGWGRMHIDIQDGLGGSKRIEDGIGNKKDAKGEEVKKKITMWTV
jgi:hypothetical protein